MFVFLKEMNFAPEKYKKINILVTTKFLHMLTHSLFYILVVMQPDQYDVGNIKKSFSNCKLQLIATN